MEAEMRLLSTDGVLGGKPRGSAPRPHPTPLPLSKVNQTVHCSPFPFGKGKSRLQT